VEIVFRTKKLGRVLNSEQLLIKDYGPQMARKVMVRMTVLRNAPTLAHVPTKPPDRCHELKGKRTGQFAVDLLHPFRLIFRPFPKQAPSGQVTKIEILSVEDYH
jgi:toxin HigB-1